MVYTIPMQIAILVGAIGTSVGVGAGAGYVFDAITKQPPTPYRAIFGVSETFEDSAAESTEIQTINAESQEKNYKCKIGSGEAFDCTLQKPVLTNDTSKSILAFFKSQKEGLSGSDITWAKNKNGILKSAGHIYKITAKEGDLSRWDGDSAKIEVVHQDTTKKYASIKPLFSAVAKDEKISAEGKTEYFVGQAKTGATIATGSTCSWTVKLGEKEEATQGCSIFGNLTGASTSASQKVEEDTLESLYFSGLSDSALTQVEASKHYIIKIEGQKPDISDILGSITLKTTAAATDNVVFEKIRPIMIGGSKKFMFIF